MGCLSHASLGQSVESLTKKQRKRRRRKDSKQSALHLAGLRHVTEELESDYSNPQELVTGGAGGQEFRGAGGQVFRGTGAQVFRGTGSPRIRLDSWADTRSEQEFRRAGGQEFRSEQEFSTYNGNNTEAAAMQSTSRKEEFQADRNGSGWRVKDSGAKTVRFPTTSNTRQVGAGQHLLQGPSVLHPEISNIYSMLDNR